MSQTLYELDLARRHIEELANANRRHKRPRPPEQAGFIRAVSQGLGRVMIRAGEALGGRETTTAPLYSRPRTASRLP